MLFTSASTTAVRQSSPLPAVRTGTREAPAPTVSASSPRRAHAAVGARVFSMPVVHEIASRPADPLGSGVW
jgi:hypothetical protein